MSGTAKFLVARALHGWIVAPTHETAENGGGRHIEGLVRHMLNGRCSLFFSGAASRINLLSQNVPRSLCVSVVAFD